ncbi:MAG: hypothetical protein H8D56_09985 [Planctomycetes bacterium]|nr:hypothetical protein [Planctomycetota bacterium]MBL7143585.1 hypothetical protein [Phycisphaerae bacterium]
MRDIKVKIMRKGSAEYKRQVRFNIDKLLSLSKQVILLKMRVYLKVNV